MCISRSRCTLRPPAAVQCSRLCCSQHGDATHNSCMPFQSCPRARLPFADSHSRGAASQCSRSNVVCSQRLVPLWTSSPEAVITHHSQFATDPGPAADPRAWAVRSQLHSWGGPPGPSEAPPAAKVKTRHPCSTRPGPKTTTTSNPVCALKYLSTPGDRTQFQRRYRHPSSRPDTQVGKEKGENGWRPPSAFITDNSQMGGKWGSQERQWGC